MKPICSGHILSSLLPIWPPLLRLPTSIDANMLGGSYGGGGGGFGYHGRHERGQDGGGAGGQSTTSKPHVRRRRPSYCIEVELNIPQEAWPLLIGPGGSVIREITGDSSAQIDVPKKGSR